MLWDCSSINTGSGSIALNTLVLGRGERLDGYLLANYGLLEV